MKILLELDNSPSPENEKEPNFEWLSSISNSLLVVQRRCMKILSITDGSAVETHAINLTDSNVCTYWSWNKSADQLAIVLNRKSVYIWDAESNIFNQIKPALPQPKPKTDNTIKRKNVELVRWSKLSQTLLICYSTGQLLLYKNKPLWEKFIDNSDGVLSKVISVDCSDHVNCFGCITETSEVLVMTFAGSIRFYMRGDIMRVVQLKFSPLTSDETRYLDTTNSSKQDKFWFAYQTESNKIYLNELCEQTTDDNSPVADLIYLENELVSGTLLVDFFWLSSRQLVVCLSNGIIRLVQIKISNENSFTLLSELVLDINSDDESNVDTQVFKSFSLKTFLKNPSSFCSLPKPISFLAMSSHSIYYYDIFKTNEVQEYTFEKLDHLDLKKSFSKIDVELEFVKLNCDSSMLAMQLSNGHLLVYQSRLQNMMVSKHGGRIAYLSSLTEVTVLNYGSTTDPNDVVQPEDNAQTFSINFRPSIISVGPKHLAMALNNRIRFYLLNNHERTLPDKTESLIEERNCISVVTGMSLCSRFVVVQFDDYRLKLHPLKTKFNDCHDTSISSSSDADLNERFFPDPSKPEKITSYLLTEHLLVYSTEELRIVVFSLDYWTTWQVCEYSKFLSSKPIKKLVSNTRENKFVCLPTQDSSVFVYDLCRNSMTKVLEDCPFSRISEKQLTVYSCSKGIMTTLNNPWSEAKAKYVKLNQVNDAVWDTDGRTLLLVQPRFIIVLASLDHTLCEKDFSIEFVGMSRKCMSYNVLYSSQGIVSFQTPLGRVVNLVLESHDDEQNLIRLEQQISSSIACSTEEDHFLRQCSMMNMKIAYLRSILPIYSLTKCQQICQYLMEEEMLNYPRQDRYIEVDDAIWRQLSAWALYTMQLNSGLNIYRKYKLLLEAQVLRDIIKDVRMNGFDTKSSLKAKLFVLLGCEL